MHTNKYTEDGALRQVGDEGEGTNGDSTAVNRELEEFVYVASHDLKAPLRDIRNLVRLLNEDVGDDIPEQGRQWLQLISDRTKRMQKLLDDLLDYSRAGRVTPPCETFPCMDAIQSAASLAGCPPGFSVVLPEDGPRLRTPRAPLETVLRNLIGNAIKHHGSTAGCVEVDAEEAGSFVRFGVTDDGPGIPPEHQERVFLMFQTLRPRDEVEGTGMGLALVKKLVESFGGWVTLESVPGQGCRFEFTWPKKWPPDGE